MALSLTFFGGFTLQDSDGTVLSLPTRKVSGLLAYLAVNADRPQSREQMMTLLWGERSERKARQSLNHALRAIRKLERFSAAPLLETDGEQVTLPGDAIDIDIVRFQTLLADQPTEAAALYIGPFLDGLAISEPEFENWLAMTRADFHDRACEAFERAARRSAEDGDLPSAATAARSLMRLDPVRESGHQLLMQLLYLAGDRASALRQYQACTEALQRELDVTPGSTTRRLYEAILRDTPVERKPAAPIPPAHLEGLVSPTFVAPTIPKTNRQPLRTGLIWATMLVGINVVPWQLDRTAPVDHAKHLHSAMASSSQGMVAAVERKTFGSSVERDAWYAGARQTVEQIYNRRLKSLIASWNLRDCDAASSLSTDVLCRDIAYRIQRLEQQRTAELDAVRRLHTQALVSPPPSRSETNVASETVKRPALVKGPSNDAPSPNAPPARETQAPSESDQARTASKATGSKPVAAKLAPSSTPIAGEVRRDYAERPDAYPQKTNTARGVPLLSKTRWQNTPRRDREQETALPAQSSKKLHVVASVKPVLAPIPKRKPASPATRAADKPTAAATMIDAAKPERAERLDKGTISRAVSETGPTATGIAASTNPPPAFSTADFEKDQERIAQAIRDYYDITGHSHDIPDSAYDRVHGMTMSELTRFTVQNIGRNKIEVLADYVAASGSVHGAVSMVRKSRFILKEENGEFTVLRMRAILPQIFDRLATGSTSRSDGRIDFHKDEQQIAQAISDYYDVTGYAKDFPTSTNGAWLDEITSMTLYKESRNHIQVDARYVAIGIYENTNRSLEGRFTLAKMDGAYRVVASRSLQQQAAAPADSKIAFNENRDAIAQAISDYYDITGYTRDFQTSTNGAWLDEITSMSLRKSSGNRIQVDATYVAVSIYSNAELSGQGRFTLEKSNGTYRVLYSSSPDRLLANPSRMKLNFGEEPENVAQSTGGNYL